MIKIYKHRHSVFRLDATKPLPVVVVAAGQDACFRLAAAVADVGKVVGNGADVCEHGEMRVRPSDASTTAACRRQCLVGDCNDNSSLDP